MESSEISIRVEGVSKKFKIPHEKISSLRGAFVNIFKKKNYEEFKALDDVSFEVKKGEFFGIIGRNGSGKSTLLKILAGVYQADKGKIHINGRISPFLELGIGFNPELSGRDNIYLNAIVLGLSRKQIDEKFEDIVRFSELERFIDQKLKNYSSGMQVRLAFSVAVHANREILLMDEVLAVGDVNFQSKCIEEFNRYRASGKTVVLVTHDVNAVRHYCDRALLIRDGEIIKIGKPPEVVEEYMNENIRDEEKRLAVAVKEKEEKIENEAKDEIKEKERKKIAEIISIEFRNSKEKITNSYKARDDILIRIYFKINEPVETFNFGFGLYNIYNHYVFGVNTIVDKIETDKFLDRKYIQLRLSDVTLLSNMYYIKCSIVKKGFLDADIYDYISQSQTFRVLSTKRNEGIYEMSYRWE